MIQIKWFVCGVVALSMIVAAPASATTLVRQGLEDLVAANGSIVVGDVRDVHSYWNADGSFILTDVYFTVREALKGDPRHRDLTITIMGGSVGDLTTLIIGGAELIPGNSYVLFLNDEDLPGVRSARTVRDHAQGVFDVGMSTRGLRAVSQATRLALVPDAAGRVDAPGGVDGIPLETMVQSIREMVGRAAMPAREVK